MMVKMIIILNQQASFLILSYVKAIEVSEYLRTTAANSTFCLSSRYYHIENCPIQLHKLQGVQLKSKFILVIISFISEIQYVCCPHRSKNYLMHSNQNIESLILILKMMNLISSGRAHV